MSIYLAGEVEDLLGAAPGAGEAGADLEAVVGVWWGGGVGFGSGGSEADDKGSILPLKGRTTSVKVSSEADYLGLLEAWCFAALALSRSRLAGPLLLQGFGCLGTGSG